MEVSSQPFGLLRKCRKAQTKRVLSRLRFCPSPTWMIPRGPSTQPLQVLVPNNMKGRTCWDFAYRHWRPGRGVGFVTEAMVKISGKPKDMDPSYRLQYGPQE